ncbi:MAG: S8 family serine peptidase, partial [Bacteroidales bacterium]|nr:S8 family serine peptidase [Bacteroidales bacterium]
MKKYLLLFACVIATSAIFAQNKVLDNNEAEPVKQGVEYSARGLSATSAFLYIDLKQGEKNLAEKYDFVKVNGEWNVTSFVVVADEKIPLLKNYGVILNDEKDVKFKSATIPVANFVAFVEDQVADFVDIGFKYDIKMDSARYYSNADIVQKGGGRGYTLPKGYCGKDVVVGIIDVGFDYTHRNFYDTTETRYRVKRVWDQNASGTAPSGFNYGNELTTQSAILAALYSHNNETHGCHVAGIAGGGGANDNNTRKYRGMAPESDLVFVSTNGNSSRLYDGIKYVFAYAASVGKPCVVNLSWGSQVGPHDGTDAVDQNCDGYILNHYPEGSLIVISAGNEGSDKLHQSKTFSNNDSILRTFAVTTRYAQNVASHIDLWGQVGNTFAVKVSVVDTQSRTVISSTRFGMSSSISGNTSISNCAIQYYIYPTHPYNNKPNITLYINNSSESSSTRKVMIEVIATRGTVHEWINKGYFSSCNYPGAVAGNTNYTINAWGQGENQIMVASHNTRKYWGGGYYITTFSGVGAHSSFSSIGPSLTSGKIKPDISAPGCMIISSYNQYASTSYDAAFITNTITNGNHTSVFGAMQGTSMAAPACAGILALWLEAYPQLTANQVKWLFKNYSITDNFTGTIPSTGSVYFGRGKINAAAGLQAILQKTAKPAIVVSGATRICPGNTVTLTAPSGYAQYIWNTGDTSRSITVSQAGSYYVRAVSAEGFRTPTSDTIRVSYLSTLSTSIAQGNQTICQGQSATLAVGTAGMGTTYSWSTNQTGRTITVTPNQTTRYWVTTSQPGSCPKTDTITVTVQPYLTTSVNSNPTICQGDSITLSVNGGTSHTWNTGATASYIKVSPSSNTSYTVTSSATGYCSKTDTINVTVRPYVTTSISNNQTICQGSSVNLTVSGGTSRVWSHNNSTANSVTVSPTSTTTYYVTSSESGKCSKTDSVTITVRPNVSTSVTPNQTICQGSSVTLTVNGGTSRVWSHNNSTANSVTVTPTSTTTYTVTTSQSGYCPKTDNITVTVQPYVSTTITQNQTICQGSSVNLTVTGGTSRVWSHNNSTANSVTVSPTSTTTYSVTSSASGYCSKTDNVTVTVLPYVSTTISPNQTFCQGSSVTLTVSGGTSRVWSNGATTSSITVTPSQTTTYTVTSSENGKCATTDTVTVSMRPTVATTVTRDTTICIGSSVTLSVNGGRSRVWNTGDTTRTITVTPASTTSYIITSTQNGYCNKIDTIKVTVQPYVSTTITPYTTICQGNATTLRVSGGTSRLWNNGATTTSITVMPSSTTTYTVTSSQNGRCSTTDTVTVAVRPYVSTTVGGNRTICQGSSATLTVSGGTSSVWSTGDTTRTITVTPNATTTYSVTSSESGKCSKTDNITVTVQPYVSTTVTNNPTICQGSSTTLTVSGGTSYTWNTGETTQSITVTPNATSTYTVTGRENGKCPTTDTIVVTVQPYVTTTVSSNPTICQGSSATLTVSGGTSRVWSTGDTTRTITVTPNAT